MARGSVRNRKDSGRGYEARWSVKSADGRRKQHSKSFRTKLDAERYLTRILGDAERGDSVDPERGKTSFHAVAELWLGSLDKNLRQRTLTGYRNIVEHHLIPAFGPMPVASITPGDIHRFLNGLETKKKGGEIVPASNGTKRNVLRVLSPIMNLAVLDGMIRTNPVNTLRATMRMPRTPKGGDLAFLTAAQVEQLADEVGPKHRTLILMAAYTGLRSGELAALKVKDVDLDEKRVFVRESVADQDGKLVLVKPKTGVTRRVALPAFLVEELRPLVEGRDRERHLFGDEKPLRHKYFYAKNFIPARDGLVERGDWPERLASLRFHDLRHTAASLAIQTGAHPKVVQERLGHSSITITMDRYGHLYEGHDEELADELDVLVPRHVPVVTPKIARP